MALLPVLLDMVDEIYSNLDNPEKLVGDIPLLFVPHGRHGRGGHGCPRKGKEHHHGPHGHHGHKHKHSDSEEEAHSSGERKVEGGKHGHCGRKEKRGLEGGRCRFADMRRSGCPYRGFSSCPRFGGRHCPCKKTAAEDFKVTFDVKSFNPDEISVKVKGREIFVDGKHDERADEHGFVSRQFTRRYVVPEEYDMETVAPYMDSDGNMTIVAAKPKPPVDESAERIIPIERVASVQEEVGEALKDMNLMDEDTNDSKTNE